MIRNRYRKITSFFARLLAGFIFCDLILPRLGLRAWSRRTRPRRLADAARRYRRLAVQMGGVLIKVGQFLSTRVDVLPPEFTNELAGLQDEVPAESFADIRRVAEAEYGRPLEEMFAAFETQPLAAASLGQVHRARVQDQGGGLQEVVVKVQRPNIETIIATDLAALRTVGGWLRRYPPIGKRADVPALLAEFTRILYEEIDYLAEGRNAETFAANFKNDPAVRVPAVIWSHTSKRALTLENVLAIKITDYAAIEAAGIDRAAVASRLLDTYLRQIFEDGFFHADPHPGNLFVEPEGWSLAASRVWQPPETAPHPLAPDQAGEQALEGMGGQASPSWQLTFVDFGMVGRVPHNVKAALREMLIGVGTQDAARVVKSYQMLGLLLPGADLELLEKAEAKAFERFWGKSMKELQQLSPSDVYEFVGEFRELLYTLPFQVPQDIIFLARCVGILSGMCTGLDPQFNVWEHLAPYAEKLIAEEIRGGSEFWLGEIRSRLGVVFSIPLKLDGVLAKLEKGEIAVRAPEISRQVARLEASVRLLSAAIIFIGLLLGGIFLWLQNQQIFGLGLMGLAALILLWILGQWVRWR